MCRPRDSLALMTAAVSRPATATKTELKSTVAPVCQVSEGVPKPRMSA